MPQPDGLAAVCMGPSRFLASHRGENPLFRHLRCSLAPAFRLPGRRGHVVQPYQSAPGGTKSRHKAAFLAA